MERAREFEGKNAGVREQMLGMLSQPGSSRENRRESANRATSQKPLRESARNEKRREQLLAAGCVNRSVRGTRTMENQLLRQDSNLRPAG
jgi:hypothetical protein